MSDDPFDSITDDLDDTPAPPSGGQGDDGQSSNQTAGGRSYAQELVSEKINGRQRTFFIDLKESSNGKFIKMSELSRGGQRSTIMFDIEDLDPIIEALEKVKKAA
jgi:hypothetical protein